MKSAKLINDEFLTEEEAFIKHEGLIWIAIRKVLSSAQSRGIERDDLYGTGCEFFIQAYRGFDNSKGYKFSTYAMKTIWGGLMRYVRDFSNGPRIPRDIIDLRTNIFKLKDLPVCEIAEKLGKSESEIQSAISISLQPRYLDEVAYADDGDIVTLKSLLPVEQDFTSVYVEEIISQFSERDQHIIRLRLQDKGQVEIAKDIGSSQPQVSRILKRIKKQLREITQEQEEGYRAISY